MTNHFFEKLEKMLEISPKEDVKKEQLNPKTRDLFWDECARNNRRPVLVIMLITFCLESIMIVLYIADFCISKQSRFFPEYIYMYSFMAFISLLFIILLKKIKDLPAILMKLELFVILTITIWSAVFSGFDVRHGFSSYLFIQFMIINALFFRIKPVKHCLINLISFMIYMVMVLNADFVLVTTFAEVINPLLMLCVACVVIVWNDKRAYQSYIDHILLKEQFVQLEYYANNDFLTNIANRKNIIEYLDQILLGDKRNISCMMIDIDDFKLYNDTYGHIMGDHCLVRLTNVIEKYVLDQGGRVGRYGGEEFLVLFTDKTENCIMEIANNLISIVRDENIEFAVNGDYGRVTVSMGVCFEEESGNIEQDVFLGFADMALYRAKNEGKNKVCIYKNFQVN